MVCLITFGKICKNIINPIMPILIMLFEYSIFQEKFDKLAKHKIVLNLVQSISKCFAIMPLLIYNLMNKKANRELNFNKTLYKKEYYEKYNKINCKKILKLIL